MLHWLIKKTEKWLLDLINVDRYLPIQMDITNLCNLRCKHCYHTNHKNDGAIDINSWKSILDQYKNLVIKLKFRPYVIICGGEPLLNQNIFKLLDFITNLLPQSKISILTNGTILNQSLLDSLKRYDQLSFQVSLDGYDNNSHDFYRGTGSFEVTINNIKLLRNNNFKVNVLTVLSKKTSVCVEQMFVLAKYIGFSSLNFTRFIPQGYGRNLYETIQDEPLSPIGLQIAYKQIIHYSVKYNIKTKTQIPLMDLVCKGLGRSGKFWESIVINYKGQMMASSRSNLILGNPLIDGLENIFLENNIYKQLRLGKIHGCKDCNLINVCGGDRNAAYAHSGDFFGKDPACWKTVLTS